MTEPQVRQIYAKRGDTGRVLDISLDQTPEDGTLRILRPDGTEVTSEAVTGGEESGSTFESLTEADVTELSVGIEPVQDLNGYDKPWVGGAGKNKWAFGDQSFTREKVITLENDIPAGTYMFSAVVTSTATTTCNLVFVDTGGNNISRYMPHGSGRTSLSAAVVATNPIHRVILRSADNYNSSAGIDASYVDIQIESGSSATAYEPYSNICPITGHDEVTVNFGAEQGTADETYTTSLGQTVYGGTLDMVTGVLTVDRAEYQLSGMTATLESNNRWFFTSLQSVIKIPSSTSVATTTISDRFVAMSNVEMANTTNIGLSVNGQGNLIVRNGSSTDQPTGQIVIPLATPVEYQLTAQQIKTLVGTNNVWASSGDIVSIKFTYGGLLSELPSGATEIVGKCYCDVEQNGVSSMPFTLNVKKNERES